MGNVKKKKVIIIGAGPAGLTAGYQLLRQSNKYDVLILEADNQVGGISKTINYKGNRMDLGGHRFFSKKREVVDFWLDMLPMQGSLSYDDKVLNRPKNLSESGPNPEQEDEVMLKRDRVSRIYYNKKFFDYPVSLNFKTIKNLGLVKICKCGFSYLKSLVIKKKDKNLENFYINRFGRELYETFFKEYTTKLWGVSPSDIADDWGSQRVKGLSVLAVLKDSLKRVFKIKNNNKETSLIESYMYPKYGPGELWEKVLEEFKKLGGKIKTNAEVKEINFKNNKIVSLRYLENNDLKTLNADIFISSMPLKDLICSFNKALVPHDILEIATNLPYRDFITIGLLVKKLKLKNDTNIKTINGIVPDCWIYVQEPNIKMGRIQIFNNWSPYMVRDIDNNVWLGLEYFCNENDDFWNLSDKKRTLLAICELVEMGIINEEDVIDYHTEKVKKAYPAYFGSYNRIDDLIEYLNKFDNLYCIGRNGQHRYNNMDHSMLTGMLAVNNIIENKKDKTNIWHVNTEGEYHEEKK